MPFSPVTGCSLGKRSMRWIDYGIRAATFVNLDTGKAVRIVAREESRNSLKILPEIENKYARQLDAYRIMPQEELFTVEEVTVTIPEQDMPGRPLKRIQCQSCGDWVQDCRDVEQDGKPLCRLCPWEILYQKMNQE